MNPPVPEPGGFMGRAEISAPNNGPADNVTALLDRVIR
jgi:hypothetical protein